MSSGDTDSMFSDVEQDLTSAYPVDMIHTIFPTFPDITDLSN